MVKLTQIENAQNNRWCLSTLEVHKGDMAMSIDFGDKTDTFSFDVCAIASMLGYQCQLGLTLQDIQKLELLWIHDALHLPNELRYQIWMHVLFNKPGCTLKLPERPVLTGKTYNYTNQAGAMYWLMSFKIFQHHE